MSGNDVVTARKARGWRQQDLAVRLGVSQPYVSLLERNRRTVPARLARRLSRMLTLSPTALPLGSAELALSSSQAASALGQLGYSGFAYLRHGLRLNPAEVLVRTLRASHVDTRLVEALPWVLLTYPNLDWHWTVRKAKEHDLQNRLGFVVTVTRRLAEHRDDSRVSRQLAHWEQVLERSRLQQEETFRESLTAAERQWLRLNRSQEAEKWNILSTLTDEGLRYAV